MSASRRSGIEDTVGTTTFDLSDRLGTASRQTDAAKSTTATRSYDAFGMLQSTTGTPKGPFGFAGAHGYQEDGDTGLKLLGHRYYDPSTGRFLTRDPIKDGRNWYGYCEGNPTGYVDPEGLHGISDPKTLLRIAAIVYEIVKSTGLVQLPPLQPGQPQEKPGVRTGNRNGPQKPGPRPPHPGAPRPNPTPRPRPGTPSRPAPVVPGIPGLPGGLFPTIPIIIIWPRSIFGPPPWDPPSTPGRPGILMNAHANLDDQSVRDLIRLANVGELSQAQQEATLLRPLLAVAVQAAIQHLEGNPDAAVRLLLSSDLPKRDPILDRYRVSTLAAAGRGA